MNGCRTHFSQYNLLKQEKYIFHVVFVCHAVCIITVVFLPVGRLSML